MLTQYRVIQNDVANGLMIGQVARPYYEDDTEMIIPGIRPETDHHVRKNGEYFKSHFQKEAI
ncbi:hypothetical protein [Paenibacillus durus]|uniref:Uncharacterized protein n=1 Tax=Paenibacillus durus ATCC 35681 TaxID=1333534 RepID=A0A0F7FBH5_PAEDU|nr:hypothetical protein [Paenibacillus durus]AKG36130.1 hypothetical protein VK70_17480 [Paenibacillus durus ATCC 35681]